MRCSKVVYPKGYNIPSPRQCSRHARFTRTLDGLGFCRQHAETLPSYPEGVQPITEEKPRCDRERFGDPCCVCDSENATPKEKTP